MEERILKKQVFDHEMEEIVKKFANFKDLKKPVTYVENGLGSWYTCVLFPGMEPTNNPGEQAMREHVLMRRSLVCSDRKKAQITISILHLCLPPGNYKEKIWKHVVYEKQIFFIR